MLVRPVNFYVIEFPNTKKDVQNQKNHTALPSQAPKTGHNFNLRGLSVVGHEEITKKRKTLEVVNTLENKNNINFKSDSNHLRDV